MTPDNITAIPRPSHPSFKTTALAVQATLHWSALGAAAVAEAEAEAAAGHAAVAAGRRPPTFKAAVAAVAAAQHWSRLPSKYLVLQGSATYLFQGLGIAGRAVPRAELDRLLAGVLADAAALAATGTVVPCQTVANAVLCATVMAQFPAATHFFAQRTLADAETGAPLPTQLWAGFAARRQLDLGATAVLEVGSGEVKIFRGGAEAGKADAAPLFAALRDHGPAAAACWLDGLAAGAGIADRAACVMFGTAALRTLPAIPGVEVISQADEAALEHLAIVTALGRARPAALAGMAFSGNLGWGNGSAQGYVDGGLFRRGVGLKQLMAAMGVDVAGRASGRSFAGGAAEFRAAVAAAAVATTSA